MEHDQLLQARFNNWHKMWYLFGLRAFLIQATELENALWTLVTLSLQKQSTDIMNNKPECKVELLTGVT